MKKQYWRKPYDQLENGRVGASVATENKEPSMAVQFAPDADINVLVKRMGIVDGSVLPGYQGINDPRYYGDFSEAPTSLKEALTRSQEALDRFSELPAAVRARFYNDPVELVDWINDPANFAEAVKIGLLVPLPLADSKPEVNPPAAAGSS